MARVSSGQRRSSRQAERERKRRAGAKKISKLFEKVLKGGFKPLPQYQLRTMFRDGAQGKHRILVMKDVVSLRGRVSHAQAPLIGMPTTAQDFILSSSVIRKVKYWSKNNKMRIWFVSGHVYDYFDVPEVKMTQLGLAPSKGRYFYYEIRTSFKYTRVK